MAQLSNISLSPPRLDSNPQGSLTESQIVLMDEAHYMSDAQLKFFKARLSAVEEMLEARMKTSADDIAAGVAEADPIDRASAEEEHQMAIASRARDLEQLAEVQTALARIVTGDFGWCVETGEMIGIGRLLVCPTAVLCIEAQQRREAKKSRYRS